MILTSLLIASVIVISIWIYKSYKPYFDTTKQSGHRNKNLTSIVFKLTLNSENKKQNNLIEV